MPGPCVPDVTHGPNERHPERHPQCHPGERRPRPGMTQDVRTSPSTNRRHSWCQGDVTLITSSSEVPIVGLRASTILGVSQGTCPSNRIKLTPTSRSCERWTRQNRAIGGGRDLGGLGVLRKPYGSWRGTPTCSASQFQSSRLLRPDFRLRCR